MKQTDFSTWTRANLEKIATEMAAKLQEPETPTLRDMFAMFALARGDVSAVGAYVVADAMLKERNK